MKEIFVSTIDGEVQHVIGEIALDPIENSLIVHYMEGGMIRFYWPNVISVSEQEYDPR